MRNILLLLALSFSLGCQSSTEPNAADQNEMAELPKDIDGLDIATFAGGCFWCTEAVYERIKGVKYVISGYSGGNEKNPTYKQVSYGNTTHAEAIQVYFDPSIVSFETLVQVFFKGAHDATQVDGQGPDRGRQYRSVAFYRNASEKEIIETSIEKIEASKYYSKPIATEVVEFDIFYPAEKYHQDYYPDNMSNPYVRGVSKPKVEKFEKLFPELLKPEYQ